MLPADLPSGSVFVEVLALRIARRIKHKTILRGNPKCSKLRLCLDALVS